MAAMFHNIKKKQKTSTLVLSYLHTDNKSFSSVVTITETLNSVSIKMDYVKFQMILESMNKLLPMKKILSEIFYGIST